MHRRPTSRRFAAILTAATAALGFLSSGPAAAAGATAAADATAFQTVRWEELVPKGWNPLKDLQGMDLGLLRDGDPKATALLNKMREVWDNAPVNAALDGKPVRIPGFVVPLEESRGVVKEFLLVPYFGACIHSPPPPSNMTVHVVTPGARKDMRMMDTVWVSGTLRVVRNDTYMGVSGWRLDASRVEPFKAPPPGQAAAPATPDAAASSAPPAAPSTAAPSPKP